MYLLGSVSIQPKPKKGLVVGFLGLGSRILNGFNPAEAEEGFSRLLGLDVRTCLLKFQSSRSRRRV